MRRAHGISRWTSVVFFTAFLINSALNATELSWSGPATVRADVAALLFSGQNGGDLALAVLPFPLPASPQGSASVAVFVEVAGPSLLAQMAGPTLEVEIFAYVLGERNQILAHRNGRLEIDLEEHRQGLENAGLALALGLDVPPGEHRLRLLVRRSAEVFGLRSMPLSILEPQAPLLLPPLFQRPRGRWLTARLGLPEEPGWAAGIWPPAGRPVWTSKTPIEFLAIGRLIPQDATMEAHLMPATGDTAASLEVALLTTPVERSAADGLLLLHNTFDSASFAPGIYRLSLHLTTGAATVKSPPIEVFIGATETDPSALWTDLLAQATGGDGNAHRVVAGSAAARSDLTPPRRSQLQTLYVEALQSLARGAQNTALERLQTLEERALYSPQAPGAERLATAQSAVLNKLVKISPQALLPLC